MLKIENNIILACMLCFCIAETNTSVVSFIKPCKLEDKACLVSSSQAAIPFFSAGIPELGIKGGDPIVLDLVKIDDANLKLNFRNNHIVGLSKAKFVEVVSDEDKQTVKLVVETPLTLNGQYDLKGKILFIEALGDGDYEFKTNKVKVTVIAKYKVVEKDNNKYWKITTFDYTYDLLEKVHIKLTNLFGGDEKRAKPIVDLFNDGWKDVVTELGGPIIDAVIGACADSVKKFFIGVPINELVLA